MYRISSQKLAVQRRISVLFSFINVDCRWVQELYNENEGIKTLLVVQRRYFRNNSRNSWKNALAKKNIRKIFISTVFEQKSLRRVKFEIMTIVLKKFILFKCNIGFTVKKNVKPGKMSKLTFFDNFRIKGEDQHQS